MVDELGRAARTGRSLEQCLSLVADDTPSPLGDEIRLCARKLELGIGLRAALEALPERTGLVSLNVLVLALSVHLVSGGDLVSVLERLSRTIRERMLYVGRLRAVTAASRATAILMIVLPPAILGFFMIRDAEYFSKLFAATWGRNITVAAIVLDAIGIAWVMRILKTSKQT
jgi:tight adherence protein B